MDTIVYQEADGIVIVTPADADLSLQQVAEIAVPPNTPYRVVASDSLPTELRYRSAWTANFDDDPCAVTVDPVKAAAIDAASGEQSPDDWFADAISEGFATPDGWKLGLTDQDVSLLTGNFVLAKEAAALGMPIPPVIDRKGEAHQIETIEELTAIMLAYGQHRAQLSVEYASRKAAAQGEG